MSDNELDNLFKEAADGFKAPNDPSAWNGMANKLDQAATVTSFLNWKSILSLAVLGVTSVALVLYVSTTGSNTDKIAASHMTLNQLEKKPIDNNSAGNKSEASAASTNQNNKNNLVAVESDQNKNSVSSTESIDSSKPLTKTKDKSGQESNLSEAQTKTSKQNALTSKQVVNEQNQASVKTNSINSNDAIASTENKSKQPVLIAGVAIAEKSVDQKSQDGSVVASQADEKAKQVSSDDVITSAENKSGKAPLIAGAAVLKKSSNSKNSVGSVVSETNSDQPMLDEKTSNGGVESSIVSTDSLKKLDEVKKEDTAGTLQSENDKQPQQQVEKSSFNRFAVKLAIAPDYTTVKSATPNSLGINYGVLMEYRISKHWSVATGGIWSKKIYSAYDVEYNGYKADWVDGDCRMWDIPVNVYYNFSSRKPFSFYASAGLSSYIMNEENYVFYYDTPKGVYDYPKQIKGENNEWFKTLNISMGMQFRMSQRFSLQFEPTLKAPLAGVGEGEVSLVSLGAFFNVRYDIPINKTRRNED